jgi:hypothetical protein
MDIDGIASISDSRISSVFLGKIENIIWLDSIQLTLSQVWLD